MSLIPWSAFFPSVKTSVPLAPDEVITKALRDTAIQWCEATRCWQEILAPMAIGGGQGNYLIQGDSNKIATCVMHAKVVNGTTLDIESPDRTDELYPRWREDAVTGQPAVLTQMAPRDFWLVPYPTTEGQLILTVAWKPKKTATRTDDMLLEEYEEGIAAGAVARLCAILQKPWSDPGAAKSASALFNLRMNETIDRVGKGFGRAPNRVRGHYF